MFQLLHDTRFDFMRWGWPLFLTSTVGVVVSIVILAVRGLNLGIEFTGGTELQLKFAQPVSVADVRGALERAGLPHPDVSTIGDPDEHEIYIRLASTGDPADAKDLTAAVTSSLSDKTERSGRLDLNIADVPQVRDFLVEAPGLGDADAQALASAIIEQRRRQAIYHTVDEMSGLPGMTPAVLDHVRVNADLGPIALRSQSYIGPAIGRELLNKAMIAITGSLIGMLVYLGWRFEFQWGLAAVLALAHDTLITLGLFSLFNQEMTLAVVAAFLTLVGYSANDTVVIFDRIRELLRLRSGISLPETINAAVNQTLSRTVITSGLTWLVVFALFAFGGSALRGFSFVLVVGIIVGSYSTIFIASPILVFWQQFIAKRRGTPEEPVPGTAPRAKKVRSSSSGPA